MPDVIARADVGTMLQEQVDQRKIALARGQPERRDTDLVLRIDVGPLLERGLHGLDVAAAHGGPQSLAFPGCLIASSHLWRKQDADK